MDNKQAQKAGGSIYTLRDLHTAVIPHEHYLAGEAELLEEGSELDEFKVMGDHAADAMKNITFNELWNIVHYELRDRMVYHFQVTEGNYDPSLWEEDGELPTSGDVYVQG